MKSVVNEALPRLPVGHGALYTATFYKTCTVTMFCMNSSDVAFSASDLQKVHTAAAPVKGCGSGAAEVPT